MQQVRGEELFFSDAGAVITSRSPAGEATAPIDHGGLAQLAERIAGIQAASLRATRELPPAIRRLT